MNESGHTLVLYVVSNVNNDKDGLGFFVTNRHWIPDPKRCFSGFLKLPYRQPPTWVTLHDVRRPLITSAFVPGLHGNYQLSREAQTPTHQKDPRGAFFANYATNRNVVTTFNSSCAYHSGDEPPFGEGHTSTST